MILSECKVAYKAGAYEYSQHTLSGIHFVKVFVGSPPRICTWAAVEGNSWEMIPLTITLEEACEFIDDALEREKERVG